MHDDAILRGGMHAPIARRCTIARRIAARVARRATRTGIVRHGQSRCSIKCDTILKAMWRAGDDEGMVVWEESREGISSARAGASKRCRRYIWPRSPAPVARDDQLLSSENRGSWSEKSRSRKRTRGCSGGKPHVLHRRGRLVVGATFQRGLHLLTTFECVRKWRVLLDEKIAPIDANSHEIVEIEHAHPLHFGLASVGYRLDHKDICSQRKECPLSYVFDVRLFVFKVFAIPTRIYNACDACCEQAFHQEGRQRVLLVMWVVARGVMEP